MPGWRRCRPCLGNVGRELEADGLNATILGSGGWFATDERETACALVRDGDRALLLDAGSGLQRARLDGVRELHILLTHFHLDHVCGLMAAPSLPVMPTIWAPGRLAYGRASEEILRPLRSSPLAAFTPEQLGPVKELVAHQIIGGFLHPRLADPAALLAAAQPAQLGRDGLVLE